MSDLVSASALTVRYGRRIALDSVDLRIEDRGAVIGLFGRNGAGKSTLIRTMCGLLARHEGVLLRPESVAYLPDKPIWYPWLRLAECVRLGRRMWSDFDENRARSLFRTLGLAESLRVRELSKGMSEQVHIALTLARRSRLYLFDEPLAAVDPLTRDRIIDLIRAEREPGSTVLLSTHLIAGLESLFDSAVVIDQGRVLLETKTETLSAPGALEAKIKEVLA